MEYGQKWLDGPIIPSRLHVQQIREQGVNIHIGKRLEPGVGLKSGTLCEEDGPHFGSEIVVAVIAATVLFRVPGQTRAGGDSPADIRDADDRRDALVAAEVKSRRNLVFSVDLHVRHLPQLFI